MNGFGGPYYNTAAPAQYPSAAPTQTPVYTGTDPTIYSTDTPALIPVTEPLVYRSPEPSWDPVWYDVSMPLQQPVSTAEPVVTSSPMPVLSTLYLPPGGGTGDLIPETVFPAESLGPIEWGIDAVGNIVQFAGDVVTTGVDAAWDLVKFIADHLEVGVGYASDIGGAAAKYKTAAAQLKAAEAAQTLAKAQLLAAQRPVTPTVTSNLADLFSKLTGKPSEATPPFVQAGTAMGGVGVEAPTNWLLLGALAIGAYLLLR